MATFLFDKIIFGPVQSRRLGVSLGVNVMNPAAKLCNFDCIYCECGWNSENPHGKFNTLDQITGALEAKLTEMEGALPNVITFAGNGEPTMHPNFEEIIDRTIEIRNRIAPHCKISVLSNATLIGREDVRRALERVDNNILKFDSAIEKTVKAMNRPNGNRTVDQTIELLKQFDGKQIIQTMFLRGGEVDNTTQEEVTAWLGAIAAIRPRQVMLYSIDRDTPATGLERVSHEELLQIAARVQAFGIDVSVV